jgi:hypothetical protein
LLKEGRNHSLEGGLNKKTAEQTNGVKDPIEALQIYRDKDVDVVEKSFDDLKNQLDMKHLRMHRSAAVDGRLFVQFITLIYMSAFKARISWFFSSGNPSEEPLECFIESDDNILQYLRMNLSQKRIFFFLKEVTASADRSLSAKCLALHMPLSVLKA